MYLNRPNSLIHEFCLPKQLKLQILHDQQLTVAQPQGGKLDFMQQAPPNQRNLVSFLVAHQSKLQEDLSPQVLQQPPTQSHTGCKYCHCLNLEEHYPGKVAVNINCSTNNNSVGDQLLHSLRAANAY